MTDQIPEHDLTLPYAERYAQAVTIAAAAQAKIDALAEQVKDHEWHRYQAEQQVDSMRTLVDLNGGKLITSTDPAPSEDVNALLDLFSGRVWVRAKNGQTRIDPEHWVYADLGSNPVRYTWPLPDAGPFIALPEAAWDIESVMAKAKARDDMEQAVRSLIRNRTGYQAADASAWAVPPLDEALKRILTELDVQYAKTLSEKHQSEQDRDRLQREVDNWREMDRQRQECEPEEASR